MKRLLFLFFFLCALPSVARTVLLPPVYIWQQWDSLTTAQSLDRDFAQHRYNGVIGVCYNAGFDVERIALAARVAKRHGLEFQAWVPMMTQQGCDSTWYTVNRLGQSAYDKPAYVPYYTTLDPHHPAVVRWLSEQCARVASIPEVDAVQLDYIRYADVILARGLWDKYGLVMHEEYAPADYCYCDDCVSDFRQRTGIDIRQQTDPSKVKEWAQFRCDNVTRCVEAVAVAIRAKGKRVTADVFPGPMSHAIPMVRQEWHKWPCDEFFMMNYNDFYLQPPSWVGKMTAEGVEACKAAGHPERILKSGLFICRDWRNKAQLSDPEHWGLSPRELPQAIKASLDAGATSICLFSAASMTPEHWAALHRYMEQRYPGDWNRIYRPKAEKRPAHRTRRKR